MAHLREVPNYYTKLKKVEGHSLGVVDNEKHVESYKRPKALSGSAKKQADALVRTFDDWFQTYSDGWPDCQHISTVVGQALEKLGHQVEVIGGDAYASDSQEEGIHYWLHIDGRFYDPKWVLLKQDDPSFSYSRHNGAWIWDVQTALNNAVEECPVLRPPKK